MLIRFQLLPSTADLAPTTCRCLFSWISSPPPYHLPPTTFLPMSISSHPSSTSIPSPLIPIPFSFLALILLLLRRLLVLVTVTTIPLTLDALCMPAKSWTLNGESSICSSIQGEKSSIHSRTLSVMFNRFKLKQPLSLLSALLPGCMQWSNKLIFVML